MDIAINAKLNFQERKRKKTMDIAIIINKGRSLEKMEAVHNVNIISFNAKFMKKSIRKSQIHLQLKLRKIFNNK